MRNNLVRKALINHYVKTTRNDRVVNMSHFFDKEGVKNICILLLDPDIVDVSADNPVRANAIHGLHSYFRSTAIAKESQDRSTVAFTSL